MPAKIVMKKRGSRKIILRLNSKEGYAIPNSDGAVYLHIICTSEDSTLIGLGDSVEGLVEIFKKVKRGQCWKALMVDNDGTITDIRVRHVARKKKHAILSPYQREIRRDRALALSY